MNIMDENLKMHTLVHKSEGLRDLRTAHNFASGLYFLFKKEKNYHCNFLFGF